MDEKIRELMKVASDMPDGTKISFVSLLQHVQITAELISMKGEQIARLYEQFLKTAKTNTAFRIELIPRPYYIQHDMEYSVPFIIHTK